jgi:drug/metabolite transporter (DMT)-like permease
MGAHQLGEVCALLAAVNWAFALVLFKRSGEQIPPLALNLFKNVAAIILLAATLLVMRDGVGTLRGFPRDDFLVLIFSGIIGITLADTLMFHGLNLIGVGLFSIVDCLYSPSIIFFSALIISEHLAPAQYVGAALILVGVFISSRHEPPADRTRTQLLVGSLLVVLAMCLMGIGIVVATPVLKHDGFPLFWGTTLRLLAGTLALVPLALASPKRKALWSVFRPAPIWKVSVPGAVLGGYLAMIFWIAGFKYTLAPAAGILNQTTVIFALILATLILKERFTRRKAVAVTLALAGVVVVWLAAPEPPPTGPTASAPASQATAYPLTLRGQGLYCAEGNLETSDLPASRSVGQGGS